MAMRGQIGLLFTQVVWGALFGAITFVLLGAVPSASPPIPIVAAALVGIVVTLSV